MAKLILVLLIGAAIYWWYRRAHALPRTKREGGEETTMVRCAECELYLPPANATARGGRWYCHKHR